MKFCCSLAAMKEKHAESSAELQAVFEDVAHLGIISLFESISATGNIFDGLHVRIHFSPSFLNRNRCFFYQSHGHVTSFQN